MKIKVSRNTLRTLHRYGAQLCRQYTTLSRLGFDPRFIADLNGISVAQASAIIKAGRELATIKV